MKKSLFSVVQIYKCNICVRKKSFLSSLFCAWEIYCASLIIYIFIFNFILKLKFYFSLWSLAALICRTYTYSFRTYAENRKFCMEELLFTLCEARVSTFSIICLATLSPLTIDRSRDMHTHRRSQLLIHGCTRCEHVDIRAQHAYTHVREKSRKDESMSFARVHASLCFRVAMLMREHPDLRSTILGRISNW